MVKMPSFLKKKISVLREVFRAGTLDSYELDFTKGCDAKKGIVHNKSIAVQVPIDYYYLFSFGETLDLFDSKNSNLLGLWPYVIETPFPMGTELKPWQIVLSKLKFHFLFKKWTALYRAIGINSIHTLKASTFLETILNLSNAIKIWISLKKKADVLNIKIGDLDCGDLIYDTYLRFRVRPTINLNDPYLLYIIYKAEVTFKASERFFNNSKPHVFITSYSSYIHHGIPARVALAKSIKVYSTANSSQFFKELSLDDWLHTQNAKDYARTFDSLCNQTELITMAQKNISLRFSGGLDSGIDYMKSSPFKRSNIEWKSEGITGVIFLHDFFDSPHCYQWSIFEDFYEWIDQTLRFASDENLRFAVKVHPNQESEGDQVVNKLQIKYPNIIFLDKKITNADIFSSGIKCGVSNHGTVLHEMAYHGITPIASGDNPHISFDFVKTCKTKDEYFFALKNFNSLSIDMNHESIFKFYYMHYLHKEEIFNIPKSVFEVSRSDSNSSILKKSKLIKKLES